MTGLAWLAVSVGSMVAALGVFVLVYEREQR